MSQSALPTELNNLVARYMYMYSTTQKYVKVPPVRFGRGTLLVRFRCT